MQKHNQWVSNRGYIQHLEVLKKIGNRKGQALIIRSTPIKHSKEFNKSLENFHNKVQQQKDETLLGNVKSKENLTMRDQQILWDNYFLGKRIIQTPPVISKRKLDAQYRKHKRLVQCLTACQSKKIVSTQFRVKKLRQYKQNLQQFTQQVQISTINLKNFIKLQIKSFVFFRQNPSLDQLNLIFTFHNKEGKRMKQRTDNFPVQKLLEKHFYFYVPRRLVEKQEALNIQIRNFKGLNEMSIGYFSIPSSIPLQIYQSKMFHCGKLIGEVQISTSYGKKQIKNMQKI